MLLKNSSIPYIKVTTPSGNNNLRVLKKTKSICPKCHDLLDATIYEEKGQVLIKKECPVHGIFEDVYWSDYKEYVRAQKYSVTGEGIENPMTEVADGCPYDCGLCSNHKSQTGLAIIDVTNRCNLRCPICFAIAATSGYVYEPTKEQIREMFVTLRNIKPVPAKAVQFSGGEPTIRDDLPELVQMAKEIGINHVEVNTNGIKLAESVDYCRKMKEVGVSSFYLSFDGVTPEPYIATRGLNLLPVKLKAIDNIRTANYDSSVLVPTVVKGVNDHQLGDIIRFAAENSDVIRCVNFQPVSITGRIAHKKRKEMRITIPECVELIEKQTDGQIEKSDFYPVPCVVPVSRAVSAIKGKRYLDFTAHEHCGMATFTFVEGDKLTPLTHYGDVEKFLSKMQEVYEAASNGSTLKAKVEMLQALRYMKFGLTREITGAVLREGTYKALGKLMRKMLMIGMMHFMDGYNFDVERAEKCCIHFAVPNGKVIPFCTMNTLHRKRIEEENSVPIKEWNKTHDRTPIFRPQNKMKIGIHKS